MMPAGRLRFLPGRALPTIRNDRPLGLARALRGQPPAQAVRWLPAAFALCRGAHRLAATLATETALGRRLGAERAEVDALQRETLAEHLRRLWLDWPRALLGREPEGELLRAGAPLLQALAAPGPCSAAPDLAAELEARVFGADTSMPGWVQAWEDGDDRRLRAWARRQATPAAQALDRVWEAARLLARDAHAPLPDRPAAADHAALWLTLWRDDFALAPCWRGQTAETGAWTRQTQRAPRHALDRLLGRLAEIARLALALDKPAPTPPALDAGVWWAGPGQALGWCQMARGLLIHAVRLEVDAEGRPEPLILDYRVLAPTEWNFHPRGAAAQALSRLDPAQDPEPACALIAAAFDPCVEYGVARQGAEESAHA